MLDSRVVVIVLDFILCLLIAGGFVLVAVALSKLARRLDAVERQLRLVSKIQRSDYVEPQQVVAKRQETS